MPLPNYLRQIWRSLRNLDRLEAALQDAQLLAADAHRANQRTAATLEQLAISRALLATTMRERDRAHGALRRIAGDLARLRAKQRDERSNSRLWITRCKAVNINQN